jgi:hypothetical protein
VSELKWVLLTEVYGRMNAELILSLLNTNEIEVELFQESAGGFFAYPTNVGEFARVQIFVPANKLTDAKDIFENSQNGSMENSNL